ncbi:hypothetical protein C8Q80DRAFT_1189814 [Daedaleopsis nitida]|nr:hypothetical protein C8Q80DRAFT_1189814 [Daedaleopsis nitida]
MTTFLLPALLNTFAAYSAISAWETVYFSLSQPSPLSLHTRGSISAVTCLAVSRMRTVRFSGPGATSELCRWDANLPNRSYELQSAQTDSLGRTVRQHRRSHL